MEGENLNTTTIDFNRILDAVTRRRIPSQVPLYEHFVDDQIMEQVMGYDFSKIDLSTLAGNLELWQKRINFYKQMGYDYVPFEIQPDFASLNPLSGDDTAIYSKGTRVWTNEHSGPIQTWDDIENDENWPTGENLFNYKLFDKVCEIIPENMKIIGGASGGPYEHATFLMGSVPLFINMNEDVALVEKLFERIGPCLTEIAANLVKREKMGVYRFGDDMGYKSSTMISPAALRKYVFPWQKKVVDIVHTSGKPFLLHSCGQLKDIMNDLIDDVGIDAKQSFEDVIMPITEAKRLWGDRVSLFGGIDVDFLCRNTPNVIKEHTKRVMEICSKGGGYAVGTGNTVANYIPTENYLAMLDAASKFNGQ